MSIYDISHGLRSYKHAALTGLKKGDPRSYKHIVPTGLKTTYLPDVIDLTRECSAQHLFLGVKTPIFYSKARKQIDTPQ